MNGIASNMDEKSLVREMRKVGFNPAYVKIDRNTITHDHKKGKGFMTINCDDPVKH